MWDCWIDFINKCKELPGRKIVVFNGDMGELDTSRRSIQLITVNKATIQNMATDAIMPLVDIAEKVIVMRGTSAHTGKSAWLEEAIASDIDTSIRENNHASSWWHFRAQIANMPTDIAHHAAMGRLPWTEKHAGIKIADIIQHRYLVDLRSEPPRLAIRSHNHRTAEGRVNETLAVCTPAWSLATEYVYRVGQENAIADIGGCYFVIENGEISKWDFILYRPRKDKKVWALKI